MRIVSLFTSFVSLMLLIKSEVSLIYEGNDLARGWRKWSTNYLYNIRQLTSGLTGMLDLWTLAKYGTDVFLLYLL